MQCSLVAHNMANKVTITHRQCAETTANASIPINKHRPPITEQAGGRHSEPGSFPQRRRAARPGIIEATLAAELKEFVVWRSCQRPTSSGWNKVSTHSSDPSCQVDDVTRSARTNQRRAVALLNSSIRLPQWQQKHCEQRPRGKIRQHSRTVTEGEFWRV